MTGQQPRQPRDPPDGVPPPFQEDLVPPHASAEHADKAAASDIARVWPEPA